MRRRPALRLDRSAPGTGPEAPPASRRRTAPHRARPGRWTGGRLAGPAVLLLAAAAAAGCWRIGEPTPDAARVTWAAYPETVVVGEVFSFEFAGPVAPNTCGRLDTAVLSLTDTAILLSGQRSVFEEALCADERVSFYEARPMTVPEAGRYPVRTAGGRELGALMAVDSGSFSRMRAVGEGTLERAGGCWFFGPGWASNQRPFALRGLPPSLGALAGTDTVLHVEGTLAGFMLCGSFGSRPSIRVEEARALGRTGADYYAGSKDG